MNTLTKQTRANIRNASKALGIREEAILERASAFYLDAIKQDIELQNEMNAWERASNEDLLKWEKKI
jgi:hypothetical protein